jgi:capsular exopolysaccharide synthesis family protein
VLTRVVEALKLYEIPDDYEKRFASPLKAALIEARTKKRGHPAQRLISEEEKEQYFESAVDWLSNRISVEPVLSTSFFQINVTDFSPSLAVLLANSVSRSYVIFDLEQQIQELSQKYGERHTSVIQLENYIKEMKKTLHGRLIPDMEAFGPASIKIVSQAEAAAPTKGVNKPVLLIMAFSASIILSILFALMLDFYDQTIRTPRDIESVLKLPFICSIQKRRFKDPLLIVDANPRLTPYLQSMQNFADQIRLTMREKSIQTLLITDAEASVDTAVVIANLGLSLTRKDGYSVLIIDTNFRTLSVSSVLNVRNNSGLADVLEGGTSFTSAIQDLGSNLHVLTPGKSTFTSSAIFDSSKMDDLINKLKKHYDFIFVSCADIKNHTDAFILSSLADASAFVINEGKVRQQVLQMALSPFQQKNSTIIGIVLNNRTHVIPGFIYKYT